MQAWDFFPNPLKTARRPICCIRPQPQGWEEESQKYLKKGLQGHGVRDRNHYSSVETHKNIRSNQYENNTWNNR
jgi:hypothetical protein